MADPWPDPEDAWRRSRWPWLWSLAPAWPRHTVNLASGFVTSSFCLYWFRCHALMTVLMLLSMACGMIFHGAYSNWQSSGGYAKGVAHQVGGRRFRWLYVLASPQARLPPCVRAGVDEIP